MSPDKTFPDHVLQINGDGPIEEVYGLVTKAVEEFIQHAEVEK